MITRDSDKFYKQVGELIRDERLKRGRSQEELAKYLDLTRMSVINLEKGRHRPSIYQLLLTAEYFDLEYSKLIPVISKTHIENKKTKLKDLSNMVIDQENVGKDTKNAVLDFLNNKPQ
jgi:transcriptional regulator with XRE-family HTH domain